ncbi:sensor histidine kinase [Terrabacter sp. 2TAF16]|uniref:sensor histidine kinase n=1 Tax=unclassified Terrabacter TaxID=2630222 RepID=UPI003F9D30A3
MGDSHTVRGRAVRRFLLWSLIALTACAGGVSLAVKAAARDIAVRDASTHGISFARDVVAPLISAAVRRGDPGSDRILDAVVGSPLRDDSLVRIKVWGVGGQVIWSDVHELHGETFTLEPEEAALFGTTSSVATLSDLSKEENQHEQGYDELLEVYAGAVDSEGKPILVESYWNSDRIVRDEIVISTRILPLAIGALVLFILTVIPLALSLARRVDQAQAERSSLLRHALAASDVERRKISRELHDGLIQDLTSLGYSLPAVAAELPAQSTSARGVLESVGRRLQGDIASLRGLLTDLYPVGLAREGLEAAVEQLAQPVRAEGVDVTIDVDRRLKEISAESTQFAYHVVREGLRNVVKHAHARTVSVVATVDGSDVVVTVDDDGVGGPFPAPAKGHLGLRLLQDDVADIGGEVSLGALPGGGSRLRARFPQRFAWSWAP